MTLISDLSGTLTGVTDYTQGSSVGTYYVNYSSGTLTSAAGHDISYADNATAITVIPKELTVTLVGTISKTYDGTDVATLSSSNYTLSGFYSGDGITASTFRDAHLTANSGTAVTSATTGTYNNKNVGTTKNVQVTGLALSGVSNYVLASATVSANIGTIIAKAISVTGATYCQPHLQRHNNCSHHRCRHHIWWRHHIW